MRFLMLTTFYPPWSFGGDAQVVQALSRALVERGHQVTVGHSVASYRLLEGKRSASVDAAVRDEHGVRVVTLDEGDGPLTPLASYLTGRPALLRRRIERLLEERFDVVHFHNPSLLGAPALFGAGDSLKLMTLHDYWLVCPMNVLTRNQRETCTKPTCLRCSLAHRRPPQLWRYTGLLPRALRGLDALLAPSASTADLHAAVSAEVRIEQLPNFVDPDPGVGEDRTGRPYFLFVGRLEPMKGAGRLLPVFARRPQDDLVIAGKGSLDPHLKRLAAGLDNVRFTGPVEGSELDSLYRGASAVIMPTIGQEACPLVLLEAQARGIPVIGSDHGALRELIGRWAGGLVFKDEAELDAALTRISTDPALRARLGGNGRAAYLREWTLQRHLARYFGLIAELSAARGDRHLAEEAGAAAAAVEEAGAGPDAVAVA